MKERQQTCVNIQRSNSGSNQTRMIQVLSSMMRRNGQTSLPLERARSVLMSVSMGREWRQRKEGHLWAWESIALLTMGYTFNGCVKALKNEIIGSRRSRSFSAWDMSWRGKRIPLGYFLGETKRLSNRNLAEEVSALAEAGSEPRCKVLAGLCMCQLIENMLLFFIRQKKLVNVNQGSETVFAGY